MVDTIDKIGLIIFWSILILELSALWDDRRGTRKLLAGIIGSFLILVLNSFLFARIRIFGLVSLMISLLCIDAIIGIYIFITKRLSLKWIKDFKINPLVLIFLLIAMQLLWGVPSMNMHGGRDDGLYFMQGIHIAKTGMFEYEEDQYMNENYEEISNWYTLGYMGIYSKYDYETSDRYGAYEFQFMPLFPAALAIGYSLGGIPLLIRMNGLIGILSLCCIYCYIKDYLGNKYHALISCYCILLSPAFLWNTRASFSEILTQCLFFCSIYVFTMGWETEKKNYAILSGIIMGLALLTRIDSLILGFGILVTTLWVCFFEKKKKKYMFTLMGIYTLCSLGVIIYGVLHNYSYLHDQWGSLRFMLLLYVIGFTTIGISNFAFRTLFFKNFLLKNKIQNIFVFSYWIIMIFLLVIRPKISEDTFAIRSVNEFTWYTSVIALFCVPKGIKEILNRNRDNVNRCMLFFFSAGEMFILYLIRPSIAEDHIWASRRWVLLGIPFVMICFVNMMDFGGSQFARIVNTVMLIVVVGYLVNQNAVFITTRIWNGIDRQYQILADKLNDEVYYTSYSRLATTLRFVFDKNVYYLDRGQHLSTKYDEDKIVSYLADNGKSIYYIGSEDDFKDERLQFTLLDKYEIIGWDLERTIKSYPQRLEQIGVITNVYKITAEY